MKVLCWGKEQREEIELINDEELEIGKLTKPIAKEFYIKTEPSIILFDNVGHSIYECKGIFTPKDKLKQIIKNHRANRKGWDLLEA